MRRVHYQNLEGRGQGPPRKWGIQNQLQLRSPQTPVADEGFEIVVAAATCYDQRVVGGEEEEATVG